MKKSAAARSFGESRKEEDSLREPPGSSLRVLRCAKPAEYSLTSSGRFTSDRRCTSAVASFRSSRNFNPFALDIRNRSLHPRFQMEMAPHPIVDTKQSV